MPPNGWSRPPAITPENGSRNAVSATSTITSTANLADPAGGTQQASASVFPPSGRRRWYAATYGCPWCQGVHLARACDEAGLLRLRRSGCGRPVMLTTGGTL
jgi:hypothetical protein